jgi:SecD/SecF fusion protein
MQNKGVIKFFAILFALVCLFQLSFTFFSSRVEQKAKEYSLSAEAKNLAIKMAQGDQLREVVLLDSISKARERFYLDSIASEPVYNILVRKYSYKDVKEREINLGLDLKGGMNVIMEVSVVDIIRALSGYSTDSTFNKALVLAREKQKNSNADYVTLFAESFKELDPNASLAAIFQTVELKERVKFNSTNDEVISVIREETSGAIDRTFNILRTRIDRFGVAQPNIQRLQTAGRILIELPGIKEPERVRKLLQGSAKLEFWETYKFPEIYQYFTDANGKLREFNKQLEKGIAVNETADSNAAATANVDTTAAVAAVDGDTATKADTSLLAKLGDSASIDKGKSNFEDYARENPLFAYLNPAFYQNESGQYAPFESARVGSAFIKDTARVNNMLKRVKSVFPPSLKLLWTVKPEPNRKDILDLIAIKVKSRDGKAPLGGDVIVDARQDVNPSNGGVEVSMAMNGEGARVWKNLTADNIGNQIAIVLDDYVYSYPNVNQEIAGGRSSISGGGMTIEEAQDLANILKAGKLPAPAHIVQEAVVGPSLGKEAIDAGMNSFILAFVLVLLYMVLYYNKAGFVADTALLINIFFLFGVLASFGATLTLPGIAGIVLTMGMAVDANVIIYERIIEEVRAGKGLRLALNDGYKNAYSAIIDGNATTLLTAIILYIFGSGPIQGFATTLIIGLVTSLFTSILISRVIFVWLLDKNKNISFDNKFTRGFLANTKFDFIGLRNKAYILSISLFLIAVISLAFKGLNFGVDFTGGRTYIVRFDQNVKVADVRQVLTTEFGEAPEVKSFGPETQVKITTKYMVEREDAAVDSIIETKLYTALNPMYASPISINDFNSSANDGSGTIGILTSQKVGPTIAYDIKRNAVLAVIFALIGIFTYIAIRFKKWQYGLGGVVSLFHDTVIILGLFSLFHGILPFNLEVGQDFIAAILTIIGYSINDTVIIFDRIREYVTLHPKRDLKDNMNGAINSTLARTMNTAGTTLIVLLIIFIFGGEIIRGFTFALLMGILFGTYSSVFNASPIAFDLINYQKKKAAEKAALKR